MRSTPLLFVLMLAGCAATTAESPTTADEAASVSGASAVAGQWSIRTIDGRPLEGEQPATIAFAEGRVSGTTGCNRINGTYEVAGNVVTIGPLATTRMACPPPLMARETALLAALTGPLDATAGAGGELTLKTANGTAIGLAR